MRVNIYSQELTNEVVVISKEIKGTNKTYIGAQLILHSSPMLHALPDDDDRSAVTFWLPSSAHRCEEMAVAFEKISEIFRKANKSSVDFPAIVTLDCPSGQIHACAAHESQIRSLMDIMGVRVGSTVAPDGAQCSNCLSLNLQKTNGIFKLYVYRLNDLFHIATIVGSTEISCEKQAVRQYTNCDVGWAIDTDLPGVVKNPNAITIFAV